MALQFKHTTLMILDHEYPEDVRVSNEIQILNSAGIKVILVCYTLTHKKLTEQISPGLLVVRKNISKLIYKSSVGALKFPFYFNFWRKFLRETVSKHKLDLIHAHDLPMAKVAIEIARKNDLPVILDWHENWPDMLADAAHTNTTLGKLFSSTSQWRRFEKKMLQQTDYVITVCKEMSERLNSIVDISSKNAIYQNVPNLEQLEVSSDKIYTKAFHLIYAGGITKPRGLQIVLKAIAHAKDELNDFEFSIAGDGIYKTELEKLASELGIKELVNFKGWVNQNEVMTLLSSADLAIIPHLRSVQNDHSSPNKIYQYMLSKTPVISSDCTSLKNLIYEINCGFSYEDTSHEDLAQKLVHAAKNRLEIRTLGMNGYNAVRRKYNIEKEKKSLLNLYSRILS